MFERKLETFEKNQISDAEKFDSLRKKIIASNNTGAWMQVKFIFSEENLKIMRELAELKRKKLIGVTKESQKILEHIEEGIFTEEIIFMMRPNFGDLSLFRENVKYLDLFIRLLSFADCVDLKK